LESFQVPAHGAYLFLGTKSRIAQQESRCVRGQDQDPQPGFLIAGRRLLRDLPDLTEDHESPMERQRHFEPGFHQALPRNIGERARESGR